MSDKKFATKTGNAYKTCELKDFTGERCSMNIFGSLERHSIPLKLIMHSKLVNESRVGRV